MFDLFFRRTPTIESPSIGFLDLSGGHASELAAADKSAVAPLFRASMESRDTPPACSVLFVYSAIEPSGAIRGSHRGLREIIRDSGAAIVVIASENSPDDLLAAATASRVGKANLVMTLDRKGSLFPQFFQRLFSDMMRGVSMPDAWVKLAPQVSNPASFDCPETIFACEVGRIRFR